MATSDRALDRARRFAEADRLRAGRELRTARTAAGLSLRVVSAACGISVSQLSRIERGRSPGVALEQLAVIGAVVGLDVRVRTYPGGDALRDAGQARLMNRFGAYQAGKSLVVGTQDLLISLQAIGGTAVAAQEVHRRRRIGDALDEAHRHRAAAEVRIRVQPTVFGARLDGLPAGVEIGPRALKIDYTSGEELLQKLFQLGQAISNDYARFEEIMIH